MTPASAELGVLHRRVEDADVYFVATTGPRPWRGTVRPRAGGSVQVWDPMSGAVLGGGSVGHGVPLVLAIAVDEQTAVLVEQVEARYGRRFGMQDLELADATVSSGLLSVPRLVAGG